MVLQKHGFDLDNEGQILVGGVRLKDTMPKAAYELFLKGLEAELASEIVKGSHPEAVARPDKTKLETQARYGAQVRSLINNLFNAKHLIPDGMNGCSLIECPPQLLAEAIERMSAKGHEPYCRNNSALIHAAVFGFIKQKIGRSWSENNSEQQYQQTVSIARQFLLELTEQLQKRQPFQNPITPSGQVPYSKWTHEDLEEILQYNREEVRLLEVGRGDRTN